jgi:DNA-binding NtrC family response regulator
MCLLVIETDHLVRDNLTHHLRHRGFTVRTGQNRASAAHILEECVVDVALLGLEGVGREGLEFLRDILTASPKTRVILMTPPDCLHDAIEGIRMGAFDDVPVPYDIDLLCAKIKRAAPQSDRRKKPP